LKALFRRPIMILVEPPESAARGIRRKFDHDLKARAVLGTGTGRKPLLEPPLEPSGSCDRMTLPDDSARDAALSAQPLAEPVDETPEALQREPLHFIVVILLLADIIFGLGLAVFAEKVLSFRPMAIIGCGLAALGLGVLGYFVLVGGGKRSRW
jgi:hypothetical protein